MIASPFNIQKNYRCYCSNRHELTLQFCVMHHVYVCAVGSDTLLPDSSVESHAVPVRVSPAATAFSFFCVFVLIFLLYLPFSLPCTLSQIFPATSHPLSSNRSLLILFTAFLIFLLYQIFYGNTIICPG